MCLFKSLCCCLLITMLTRLFNPMMYRLFMCLQNWISCCFVVTMKTWIFNTLMYWLHMCLQPYFCSCLVVTLTTNFSQGWANWAADHPDQEIREMATMVMAHSKATQDRHYRVTSKVVAARFAKGVLGCCQMNQRSRIRSSRMNLTRAKSFPASTIHSRMRVSC